MNDMDRRNFLKLALLGLIAGCAPKPGSVRDPEYYFSKIDAALKLSYKTPQQSPQLPSYSVSPHPFKLPEKKVGESLWRPEIIPRYQWASATPITSRLEPMGTIYRMTVHHEGNDGPNYDTDFYSVRNDIAIIRKNHLERMHAGDIGYHFIIDRSGRIWEGRSLMYQGAHVGGQENVGNIGIVLLGNFDIQLPSNAQKEALKKYLIYLKDSYNIKHSNIYTHQELKATRCPGYYLQAYMNELRSSSI